jgi:flavin reductase
MSASVPPSENGPLQEAFRSAMRRVAAAPNLVTAISTSGDVGGMTATAVCSLTVSPPALVVCLNRASHTCAILASSQRFCVNVVAAEDRKLCEVFGRSASSGLVERFDTGSWSRDASGLPILATAIANIVCIVDRQVDYATHAIFIGRVQDVLLQTQRRPLLYHDGSYGHFEALAD